MNALVYYVSGHGFGHAVRSAEIIRALQRLAPELRVHVRSSAPEWLFPPLASYHQTNYDAGVIQQDALRLDEAATLATAADIARRCQLIVRAETEAVRSIRPDVLVGDIPALPFLVAQAAGIPGVAVANFSWDWIYLPYVEKRPEYRWVLDWLRQAYGAADLLLRLPFSGDLTAFKKIEDVPLVSRPASAGRDELRARLRLKPDERAVLLSFGGLGLSGLAPDRLGELTDYTFIATEKELDLSASLPSNVRLAPMRQENYDLAAAADAVVSKPGFGIVATCIAQRVPLLYTDRGNFLEYPVLVDGIHRFGRGHYIPSQDLLAGNLAPYLEALFRTPQPVATIQTNGAEVIAERLLGVAARNGI